MTGGWEVGEADDCLDHLRSSPLRTLIRIFELDVEHAAHVQIVMVYLLTRIIYSSFSHYLYLFSELSEIRNK